MAATMPEFRTLPEALRHHATHKGDHPAFIFRHPQGARHVLTFRQVYRLGGRFAAVLRARGDAGRGRLVLNALPNSPERVVCEVGVSLSGAASVNAQCLLADGSDLLSTVRSSRASALLVDPGAAHSPWKVLEKLLTLAEDGTVVAASVDLPHLKRIYLVTRRTSPPPPPPPLPHRSAEEEKEEVEEKEEEDFLSQLEAASDWFEADDVTSDDVCSVFTTSGSSGFSKMVVHTHGGVAQAVLGHNPVLEGLRGDEVEFSIAPLGWLGGYVGNTLLPGTTRVLCDTRSGLPPDVVDFTLKAIEEENVSLTFITAPRLDPLLRRVRQRRGTSRSEGGSGNSSPQGDALQILQRITLGGQPITRALVRSARLLARSVLVLYAMTESFTVSSLLVRDPDTYRDFDAGDPLKGTEVRVVGGGDGVDDEDTPLAPGETGEILLKKPVMMKEYLHDPEATAAAFTRHGFFRTGDIGRLDDRGHVIVEGRGSDAIMRGPYIFYPGWLEERIKACPGVRDAMVVGVPDPAANEELCACLMLQSDGVTVQQVQEFVEKDIVASAEEPLSPRPRHYLAFDAFPVTSTGKPHRKVVKQEASARLSTSSDD